MMPRGDGTGPMGMGPATGRGAGYCLGYGVPGYANPVGFAGGFQGGFGRGYGFRRMCYGVGAPGFARYGYLEYPGANTAPLDEKAILSSQAEILEKQLQQIKKQLSSLDKEDK